MAGKDKNIKQEDMAHNKQGSSSTGKSGGNTQNQPQGQQQDGQHTHDESNMELGEHQSGHMPIHPQSGKSGQHQGEGQQGIKMSADEPAEGSRENVEDDLKRQK